MNEKIRKVFKGYLSLSTNERNEFADKVNEFVKLDTGEQRTLKENYGIHLGPVSDIKCPCCGR